MSSRSLVAGSEAAFRFAERGILCVVLEQNDRPYGKIEDGLPRWHVNLRSQETKKIDDKLSHAGVHFVPRTKLTGKGNIQASLKHGRTVSQHMLEHYLLGEASGYEEVLAHTATEAQEQVSAVADQLTGKASLPNERVTDILARVKALQEKVGYPGDYGRWIQQVRPRM